MRLLVLSCTASSHFEAPAFPSTEPVAHERFTARRAAHPFHLFLSFFFYGLGCNTRV